MKHEKELADLIDACSEMNAMLGENASNGFFTVNAGCVDNFRERLNLFRDADRRLEFRKLSSKHNSGTYYGDKIIDLATDDHLVNPIRGALESLSLRDWVAVGPKDDDGVAYYAAFASPTWATLLAAAPDLLEACKAMVAADNCNYDRHVMRTEGLFDKARAALAKVEAKP